MKKILVFIIASLLTSNVAFAVPAYTNLIRNNCGNLICVSGTVTFDSSYPTGGETVTPTALGLSSVSTMFAGSGGYVMDYRSSTGTLRVFQGSGASSSITGTGAAPITAGSFNVVDDATPGGQILYVGKVQSMPTLVANLTALTLSASILVGTNAAIFVADSATPSSDASRVYFKKGNTNGQRFVADLTNFGSPTFINVPCYSGQNLRIYHDASASSGASVTVDDNSGIFLTGNLVGGDVANTTIGGWSQDTASAAIAVTGTGTSSAGALSEVPNATNLSTVSVPFTAYGK